MTETSITLLGLSPDPAKQVHVCIRSFAV